MKKRNLLPTQTAPVERDNTGSSRQEQKGLTAHSPLPVNIVFVQPPSMF
ncbi:hypothetical protein NIES2100_10900 [Calothrix sp. NIES-2100]|nr:hypothetical protein NIES2100_10900 [Calothrix sp. NIES-2100]